MLFGGLSMKFHYISDLHLEFGPVPKLPGGDVLLIAGDTIPLIYLDFNRYGDCIKQYSGWCERFSSLMEQTKKYNKTFMILGNHEHYKGILSEGKERLERMVPSNVSVLENDLVQLVPGLSLFAATMWTDYGNRDRDNMSVAHLSMNDHRCINLGPVNTFRPEDAYDINRISREMLETFASKHRDDKFIVMTHHTPSLSCGHTKWGGSSNKLNYAFHNTGLEEVIKSHPNIIHWVCGHTHDSYEGYIHQCAIHINPRGYVSNRGIPENPEFNTNRHFEVTI
jgi:hypothetical protein